MFLLKCQSNNNDTDRPSVFTKRDPKNLPKPNIVSLLSMETEFVPQSSSSPGAGWGRRRGWVKGKITLHHGGGCACEHVLL